MIAGISGRLITASFAAEILPQLSGVHAAPDHAIRAAARWNHAREAALGPASAVRAIADIAAVPLLTLLGYRLLARRDDGSRCELVLDAHGRSIPAVVVSWMEDLDAAWRAAVRTGITRDADWAICTNGRALRLVDTRRTWSRRYIEFDLAVAAHIADTFRVLWTLAHADAVTGSDPALNRAVDRAAKHGSAICRALADGVLDAAQIVLRALAESEPRRRRPAAEVLEQSLTVLYRILFLLFAEARGLVPIWHGTYRERYTVEAILDALMAGRRYPGIWPALQAIARLAHAGCRAGDLRVTAFNGRLFSPLHTPAAERGRIDDETIGRALLAVGTSSRRTEPSVRGAGRTRIRYRDLDVEQLGAVYEHLLDYEAIRDGSGLRLQHTGDVRKASGTFYTPSAITAYLVRRTLAPLVRGKTAAQILALRIVDPAMGSGAFLVAACRYLAVAVEAALVREGEWTPDEATQDARVGLRRQIATQCLFGADVNPTAVQLARLSLWLATLAAERPLSFLDHRLTVGDSLAGAMLADVLARPPGRRSRRRSSAPLPLFDDDTLATMMRDVVASRVRLAGEPDDDAGTVRRKELALTALRGPRGRLAQWKSLLDLWCAWWFWDAERPPDAAVFQELSAEVLHGRTSLPARVVREWRERAEATAAERRFLHWELEFPEVFFDGEGRRSSAAGFDAVLGNPPWDMVRGDSGEAGRREARRLDARRLLRFVRDSGIYAADSRAHVNRYQLFVERALHIVRPGGRLGLVLPAGIVSDAGSAALRRQLFDRADVDTVTGMDNRTGVFPIHRSVRFVLVTATAGASTERTACRFGLTDPTRLDAIDDADRDEAAFPVTVSRSLLARMSGEDDLAIPDLATAFDLQIVEKMSARHPWLSSPEGWQVRFGRELNASDDRALLRDVSGAPGSRPVLEGKHIVPFRALVRQATQELRSAEAFASRAPRRARLAYRDVASATNRLTLIAAIVPARAVTTHTLFVLRTPLREERQRVLCALLNSFVANYLVRLRVNTHVTVGIVSRLPVPVIADDLLAARLADLARALSERTDDIGAADEYVELQALAARAYELSSDELAHILKTFPLIPLSVRDAVLRAFRTLRS